MHKAKLYQELDYVNASREKRGEMANLVLAQPDLLKTLLEIAFENNDPISAKASWIVEFVVKKNIALLLPHITVFTKSIGTLRLESSIRPMAKICELLILDYFKKGANPVKNTLQPKDLEAIAEACFDWLIGNHKVAAKAYSMTCLFHLGKKYEWIHPELKMVLEQNYQSGSAAYKARARMTLEKIRC